MTVYSTSIISQLLISSLVCLCIGHVHQENTYTTSLQPGAQNSVSYTVLYRDSVTLRCPDVSNSIARPSWGRIVHEHKVGISQCYDNTFNCTIIGGVVNEDGLHLLGHADSGLYFCRDFGSGEEYYLNLTVLVPPQIMGDAIDCESYHHCQQPHRPLDPSGPGFNITVEYLGSNVTVDWRHNGSQINCAEPMCASMDTSDGLYHKTTLTLKLSHAGKYKDFIGTYTANLSNAYGWNFSTVAIHCISGLTPPSGVMKNTDTQDLMAGSKNAQISCSVEYGDDAYFYVGMCYAPNGESFHDLNITKNCAKVGQDPRWLYNDSKIQSRPDWKMSSRDEPVLDCITKRTTTLMIPIVSMADNDGIVYCIWQDDTKQINIYEQHNLRVREPAPTWIQVNWKYIALGAGLVTGGVVLVVLLLVIASLRSWKKARRAENKLKKRRESKRRSPPLPRPEPTGLDMSDTDAVFRPNPNPSSRSSTGTTTSQSSRRIILDAEVHEIGEPADEAKIQSPLLPGGIHQHSILHYGTVEHTSHHQLLQEPGDYTDAPLICTTADEEAFGWALPGARRASKSNV